MKKVNWGLELLQGPWEVQDRDFEDTEGNFGNRKNNRRESK